MALPAILANPVVQQIGVSAAGAGINALFNKSPDVPDLEDENREIFARRRQMLKRMLQERKDNLEANQAARGVSGSGSIAEKEALFRSSNNALQNVNAEESAALSRARNKEKIMRYRQNQRKHTNRAQAISGTVGAVNDYIAFNDGLGLESLFEDEDPGMKHF